MAGLFKDVDALSLSIATDRRVGGGAKLSMWTIASKRAGIRCVARLLTPELRSLGIPDPLQVIDRALQRRSTRIGTRYSLPGGTPRGRGGKTPDVPTVRALLDALGDRQGWEGIRNQVFFEVMYLTGVRVGALTLLDGSMLRRRSDGTGQLVAHAKHGRDSGEFVIPKETMAQIDRYVTDFNLWALARGKVQRIRIGSEGALWRSITGGPMAAETPGKMLRSACKAIEIEALTPHSFRRAFATTATEALSRATVAEAGGWTGDQRMDDHYIQRSTNSVQEAIGGVRQSLSSSPIPITPLPPHQTTDRVGEITFSAAPATTSPRSTSSTRSSPRFASSRTQAPRASSTQADSTTRACSLVALLDGDHGLARHGHHQLEVVDLVQPLGGRRRPGVLLQLAGG
ncbi:MAG: site-specific integrase [Chloroflexi bacterium]|nr:site-specific integrase [Chloroflexota bacterium]